MSAEDYIAQIEHLTRQIDLFSAPKRLYSDFVSRLSQRAIDRAIDEDVKTAMALGDRASPADYLDYMGGCEEAWIYHIVAEEIEHIIFAGGEPKVIQVLADEATDLIRDPSFCAKHLAGRHLLNRTLAILWDELRHLKTQAELELGTGPIYGAVAMLFNGLTSL